MEVRDKRHGTRDMEQWKSGFESRVSGFEIPENSTLMTLIELMNADLKND